MKIGVMSDTHGKIAAFDAAMRLFDGVDLIVHAGDLLYHPIRMGAFDGYDSMAIVERLNAISVPVVIARGNCDAEIYDEVLKIPTQSAYCSAVIDGMRILVTHGHLFNLKDQEEQARAQGAKYYISGHTHVPMLRDVDGVILMNPGSAAIPKYEFKGELTPSVGIITENGAKIISLVDGSVMMEA